jgi:hypothetical protein
MQVKNSPCFSHRKNSFFNDATPFFIFFQLFFHEKTPENNNNFSHFNPKQKTQNIDNQIFKFINNDKIW